LTGPRSGLYCLTALLLLAAGAQGEVNVYESEPNDTPEAATPIAGEVALYGSMLPGDQDGFRWTVSDDDAGKRWTFTLYGVPGATTIADLVRIQYADDGSVAVADRLMQMGTRDGSVPSVHRGQLFDPGEYLIGIARAGGPETPGGSPFSPPSLAGALSDKASPADASPKTPKGAVSAADETPGAWRFVIRQDSVLPIAQQPVPGDTRETAVLLRPGTERARYETELRVWYGLTFTEAHAGQRWDVDVRVPIGRPLTARLVDADGTELGSRTPDDHGLIRFADLAPGVTTWFLELTTPESGFVQAVSSTAVGVRVQGEEAEPNDDRNLANRVDLSTPLTGRIRSGEPADSFTFPITESLADQQLVLTIDATPPATLRALLTDPGGDQAQYRNYQTPMVFPDLALAAGDWGLTLSNTSEDTTYTVTLTSQGPLPSGMEVEPNDTIDRASGVPANLRIKGRFSDTESDFFQLQVPGEPQLWRFQAMGDGLFELAYYDGGLEQRAVLRVQGEQRRLRLDDVFLLPGRHFLRVSGRDGGTYTLLARPVGPPDPNGELEPNDEFNMQRLAFGQHRTGLLAEGADIDNYRFFLGNWEHIRLSVTPPPDGIVDPDLYWYGELLGDGQPVSPGEPISVEGLFPPGDYRVALSPRQVSDGEYALSLERLPRFTCPADCEPNGMGRIWLAAPLPADLVLEGRTGEWRDTDVYQLPAFEQPTELLIRTAQPVGSLAIGLHDQNQDRLTFDADLGGYRATVPAGGPYRLEVDAGGQRYRLSLDFPNGALTPVSGSPDAELTLSLTNDSVSAYRSDGQQVHGTLEIANRGSEPLPLDLESASSDYRWHAMLDENAVTVPAGGRLSVPITVEVPADAWADRPVRISVGARDASGRQTQTWSELAVSRDLASVEPHLYWPIPDALRGGFNAAWLPFGATLDDESIPGIDMLRDGLNFPDISMACCGAYGWTEAEQPVFTLDLPGDEPLPVAGIALDHFGTSSPYDNVREAALLLSQDGVEFREVLRFETEAIETEQHFALETPVPARFARLVVHSTFEDPRYQRLSAAEWKVILEPGFDLSHGEGFNLASPALGGHLVWDAPAEALHPVHVLEDRDQAEAITLRDETVKDYVFAFHQNRAARIARIDWLYPDTLDESSTTFQTVSLSVSLNSPAGPWLPIGKLDLSGAVSEASLTLPDAPWARFVRLSAEKPPEGYSAYAPGLIRIWERPGGDDYTSVLTEWGSIGPKAFYELATGLHPEPGLVAVGNDSRASAAELPIGEAARGQVSLGTQTHWYRLIMPEGTNTLNLTLNGDPTVRTVLSLEDEAGTQIRLRRVDQQERLDEHRFEAVVDAGATVWLAVSEPPRNVVFAWDTSASVNAYIPLIRNSLVAFSGQVVPGQEAVNLMPFSMQPLLRDWYGEPYMLQTILNDHRRGSTSSSAEWTLMAAAEALGPRAGTKAVVVITDAETPEEPGLWAALLATQPRVFGIGVAGSRRLEQNLFRDWASVNGGQYTQLRYQGEMEIAFDRASTLMHRPAGYTLRAAAEFREAPGPGRLQVLAGSDRGTARGRAVELILDASGSMLQRMEGERRISIAKDMLTEAVREHIPAGTPVALRVFGHRKPNACESDLELPLGPLDPAAAAGVIAGVQAMNLAKTPIADSLAAVPGDIGGARNVTVVLVTDGEETCDGNPAAVIGQLKGQGIAVSLNIVGFAIDDAELAAQFRDWAALGGGRYFAADDPRGLQDALEGALALTYTVTDPGGNTVAEGAVGADPVTLDPGTYRVRVNSGSGKIFEAVVVEGGRDVTLTVD